jgi:hypothetical protein
MSFGKAQDAEIWDYERKTGEIERLTKELSKLQASMLARVYEHQPVQPDPVITAVTQEIKEAYGQGHDDGYRLAVHDVEVWLRQLAQLRPAERRDIANKLSTGTWKSK